MRAAVFGAIIVLTAGGVMAVDLKNEDSAKYEVKVHDGAATTTTSIDGGTTRVGVCGDCTIEVVGVGSVAASGDQVVVIKDGSLSVEG